MPFVKGQRRPPGSGRRPGVPNKATREFRDYARALLEQPAMVQAHELHVRRNPDGALALFLYGHAYGKPKDHLQVSEGSDLIARLQAGRARVAAMGLDEAPRSTGDAR